MSKVIWIIFAWVTFPAALLGLVVAILAIRIVEGKWVSFVEGFKFLFFGIEKNLASDKHV